MKRTPGQTPPVVSTTSSSVSSGLSSTATWKSSTTSDQRFLRRVCVCVCEIINSQTFCVRTGERCSLTFKPCGLFGKELHKVEGFIMDKRYREAQQLHFPRVEHTSTFHDRIRPFTARRSSVRSTGNGPSAFTPSIPPRLTPTGSPTGRIRMKRRPTNRYEDPRAPFTFQSLCCARASASVCVFFWTQSSVDEEPEQMPPPDAETVQVIPGSELIWKITPRPDNSAKVGGREVVQFYAVYSKSQPLVLSPPLVLRLLHVRHAAERAGEEHGGSAAVHRQSPQTGYSCDGGWRYRYGWFGLFLLLCC